MSDHREAETADTVPKGPDAETRPLIPQPHGGALLPPPRPGEVRNPKGRPPDAERLVARLLRRHPDSLDAAADAWAEVLRDPRNRHWLGALKEALDRTEGTVAQATHHHVSTDRAIVTHAGPAHPPALPSATSDHRESVPRQVGVTQMEGGR